MLLRIFLTQVLIQVSLFIALAIIPKYSRHDDIRGVIDTVINIIFVSFVITGIYAIWTIE